VPRGTNELLCTSDFSQLSRKFPVFKMVTPIPLHARFSNRTVRHDFYKFSPSVLIRRCPSPCLLNISRVNVLGRDYTRESDDPRKLGIRIRLNKSRTTSRSLDAKIRTHDCISSSSSAVSVHIFGLQFSRLTVIRYSRDRRTTESGVPPPLDQIGPDGTAHRPAKTRCPFDKQQNIVRCEKHIERNKLLLLSVGFEAMTPACEKSN